MKRPTYALRLNGETVATRHAWNAATIAMGEEIRARLPEGGTATRTHSEREKLDRWITRRGLFTWETSTGETWTFEIELTDNPNQSNQ